MPTDCVSTDITPAANVSLSRLVRNILPSFKFMVHDRWANVLFLHWKVPRNLEHALESSAAPFLLDRYGEDGDCYVGLVLLTEQNVGPSMGRTSWTTVTHHGVNVRTYVCGTVDRSTSIDQRHPPGIHFSSLECDDALTSFGANCFGMPYNIANIQRTFFTGEDENNEIKEAAETTREVDLRMCSSSQSRRSTKFHVGCRRDPSARPSIWRIISNITRGIIGTTADLHTSKVKTLPTSVDSITSKGTAVNPEPQETFSVECIWSHRHPGPSNRSQVTNIANEKFSAWVAERYYVYARKYGIDWIGQVEHEPWTIQPVKLDHLEIDGVDSYEPKGMRPILQHMATHRPESVLFSLGVGPVTFDMLRPL